MHTKRDCGILWIVVPYASILLGAALTLTLVFGFRPSVIVFDVVALAVTGLLLRPLFRRR